MTGYGLVGLALAGALFRERVLSVTIVLLAAGYYLVFIMGLGMLFGRPELRQVLIHFSRSFALQKLLK